MESLVFYVLMHRHMDWQTCMYTDWPIQLFHQIDRNVCHCSTSSIEWTQVLVKLVLRTSSSQILVYKYLSLKCPFEILKGFWGMQTTQKVKDSRFDIEVAASGYLFHLLITCANSLDPDQDWPGSKPFNTLIVILEKYFENINFKIKKEQMTKKSMQNY